MKRIIGWTGLFISLNLVITGCTLNSSPHVSPNPTTNSPHVIQGVSGQTHTSQVSSGTPHPLNVTSVQPLTIEGQPASSQSTSGSSCAPDFLNSDQGFVVQTNKLMYTKNGGRSWTSVPTPPGQIVEVHFVTPTSGWVVSGFGNVTDGSPVSLHIFHTSDGGAHWQDQWSQASAALEWSDPPRVFSVSNQVVYAWLPGQLLKTDNAGQTWQVLSLPTPGPVVEADFISPQVGWSVVQGTDTKANPSAGQIPPHQLVVLHTTDGGAHWIVQMQTQPFDGGGVRLQFSSSEYGLFLYKDTDTMQTILYRTADGGKSWTKSIPSLFGGRVFLGRPVMDGPSVWIPANGGAGPFPSSIVASGDGGSSWNVVASRGDWRNVYLSRRFGNTSYLVADVSQEDALLKTTDAGRTWRQLLPAVLPNKAASFVSSAMGFGLGTAADEDSILRTTDGGYTWRIVGLLPYGTQAASLYFSSSTVGYVTIAPGSYDGSGNSTILETTDGGQTWEPARFGELPTQILADMRNHGDFVEPNYFKITSAGQWVLATTGYPKLYTLTSFSSSNSVAATFDDPQAASEIYAFVNPADGWMSVLRTQKSGDPNGQSVIERLNTHEGRWQPAWAFPSGWAIEGMYRLSPTEAWVLAKKPFTSMHSTVAIFHTKDGGQTWTEYLNGKPSYISPSNYSNSFYMSFANTQDGWIVTGNGLLHTTNGGTTWVWLNSPLAGA